MAGPRQRTSSHAPIGTCASLFFSFILNRISMRFLSSPGRRDRWILWGFSHKTRMSEPVVAFLPVQGPCFFDRLFIVFSALLNAYFRSGPAKLLLSALCNLPTLATQSPDKERPVTPRQRHAQAFFLHSFRVKFQCASCRYLATGIGGSYGPVKGKILNPDIF